MEQFSSPTRYHDFDDSSEVAVGTKKKKKKKSQRNMFKREYEEVIWRSSEYREYFQGVLLQL